MGVLKRHPDFVMNQTNLRRMAEADELRRLHRQECGLLNRTRPPGESTRERRQRLAREALSGAIERS